MGYMRVRLEEFAFHFLILHHYWAVKRIRDRHQKVSKRRCFAAYESTSAIGFGVLFLEELH